MSERVWPVEWTDGECRMIVQLEEARPGVMPPEILTEAKRRIAIMDRREAPDV